MASNIRQEAQGVVWDEVIRDARQHRVDKSILLGDFNTGLAEDAQDTPFVLSDYMRVLRQEEYVDTWRHLNPHAREFTWYTKRKNTETGISEDYNGFRLDYVFVLPALSDEIVDARHVHDRTNKVSDHAIVFADLSIMQALALPAKRVQPLDQCRTISTPDPPTAMTTPDPSSDSLLAALAKARIATGNYEFIPWFTTEIGI